MDATRLKVYHLIKVSSKWLDGKQLHDFMKYPRHFCEQAVNLYPNDIDKCIEYVIKAQFKEKNGRWPLYDEYKQQYQLFFTS